MYYLQSMCGLPFLLPSSKSVWIQSDLHPARLTACTGCDNVSLAGLVCEFMFVFVFVSMCMCAHLFVSLFVCVCVSARVCMCECACVYVEVMCVCVWGC